MTERDNDQYLVRLKGVRLSFEHVYKKVASAKDGPLKYRANFIMDPKTASGKKNIALVEDVIEQIIDNEWKGKRPKFKEDRMALKDGNDQVSQTTGEIYDGYEDMMAVSAANDKKPKLKARDGQTDVVEDDDLIYSGAWVNAWVRLYAIKDMDKGGNGIFGSLEAIQFVKHGEKFEGGGIDDAEFENLGDDDDEDDDRSSRKSSKSRDDDDDRSSRRSSSRDDDRSSRRSRDDDEDRPRKPKRTIDDDI